MTQYTTETAQEWAYASELFIANPENIAGWLENLDYERKYADGFPEGPICNSELWVLLMCNTCNGNEISSVQREEARKELYRRIQAECCELIALEAAKIAGVEV